MYLHTFNCSKIMFYKHYIWGQSSRVDYSVGSDVNHRRFEPRPQTAPLSEQPTV